MVSVDEHTQVAMEVVAQTLKISEQALLRVLEALTKLLENKEQDPKDYVLDENTKDGKQKISELMKKHEKSGGVIALDENLTKQQLQDYQKELKKLGVDFSVVRNGKEDYSFFFSAAQANVIEKALKNVVERKIAVLEKDEVKKVEKDLNEVRQGLTKEQAEEVKKLYDDITTSKGEPPKKNIITYDRLSEKQKLLYSKLEELDEIKRSLFSQEVDLVDKIFANRYKQDAYVEKEITPQTPLDKVKEMVSNLDEKEQTLLQQKVGLVAEEVSENDYKEMQKNFSLEQIEKVENIFADLLKEVKNESTQENIVEKEIPPQKPLAKVKEIVSEEREKKPLAKVKEIASSLDEKEQTLLQQKAGLVAGKISENDYKEMQKNFSPEQSKKIEKIVSENVSSDIKPGAIVDGKINANVFSDLLKKVKNESIQENNPIKNKESKKEITEVKTEPEDVKERAKETGKENPKQKKVEFSLNGVKELDTKIKKEQKEVSKDKHQKQSISR